MSRGLVSFPSRAERTRSSVPSIAALLIIASLMVTGCSGGGGSGGIGPIPPIDPFLSSVTVAPAQLLADGLEVATVTITLIDTASNPVQGATATIELTGSQNTITQPSGTSGADGVLTATVVSTKAEVKTITAQAIQAPGSIPVTLADQPTVEFLPNENNVSAMLSSVVANPIAGLLANGADTSQITVTVRDKNNNVIPGKAVEITATGSNNVFTGTPGMTDANGVMVATIATTTAELKTITATVDANTPTAVVLDDHPVVEFSPTNPCVSALLSMVSASPALGILADGVDFSTITVTVIGTDSNPIQGVTVNIAATGSNNTIIGSPGVTDANGVMTATITSLTAEVKIVTATTDPFPPCPSVTITQHACVQFVTASTGCDPIERVSVSSSGSQGNHRSDDPDISADGNMVVFESDATNLVPGDTNGEKDIFVRDLATGTTEMVSVTPLGGQFSNESCEPSISGDGRFVAFQVKPQAGATGSECGGCYVSGTEIFVRDLMNQVTEMIPSPSGTYKSKEPVLSENGRYVAFVAKMNSTSPTVLGGSESGSTATEQVWLYDRLGSTTTLVSANGTGAPGNAVSDEPTISADGRYIAFTSFADNLVPGDSNGKKDVFLFDAQTSTLELVSVGPGGVQGNHYSEEPSISADGLFVAFRSTSDNLVPGDTNCDKDIFVRDLVNDVTELVSVSSSGAQGNNDSYTPSISGNGQYVAFSSKASNLVSGDSNSDWDIFVHDRLSGTTHRVSVDASGGQANHDSFDPAIASNSGCVAFESIASDLVSGDTNGKRDVFAAPRN